jgi:drug/metabolite transporter (DMT)-like permease
MNKTVAIQIMFVILFITLLFHVLILTEQIPYQFVWAGKLKSVKEMKSFETFAILLTVFVLFVLNIKFKQLKKGRTNRIIDSLVWVFAGFFAINTLGNLFSESWIELVIGSLITFTLSVLSIIIAKQK